MTLFLTIYAALVAAALTFGLANVGIYKWNTWRLNRAAQKPCPTCQHPVGAHCPVAVPIGMDRPQETCEQTCLVCREAEERTWNGGAAY